MLYYSDATKYFNDLLYESKALCDNYNIPVTVTAEGKLLEFGHNDERDAFRHAYSSAVVAYENNALISQILGDLNEVKGTIQHGQPAEELNMDLWNNRIGREIGQNAASREEIAQKVYEALQNGSLITSLSDTRNWGGLTYGAPLNSLNPIGTAEAAFAAAAVAQRRDPLVIDLDGDGFETTNFNSGAFFDRDKDGFVEQTGWVKPDDGLLVMDRNGDGIINDGGELFGDQTLLQNGQKAPDGFQALIDLDSNTDDVIDANDIAWSQIRIWRNTDVGEWSPEDDGYSDTYELFTLTDLGITSINLDYTNVNTTDANGNILVKESTFTKTDGTTGSIGDFQFQTDPTISVAEEWLDVPENIVALPDLQGFGIVYDLHQAMVRDTSGTLESLVEQFVAAETVDARNGLLTAILNHWTDCVDVEEGSRGLYIDARKLAVLEKFLGTPFVGVDGSSNPNSTAAPFLIQSYNGLYEMYYGQLMSQTHLKYAFDAVEYTWDETSQTLKGDLTFAAMEIENKMATDPTAANDLDEFMRVIHGMQAEETFDLLPMAALGTDNDEITWLTDSDGKTIISGTAAADVISSQPGVDTAIRGDANNDKLYGDSGQDVLYGNEGDDAIYAGCNDDLLRGGAGNDVLLGQNDDDTLYGGTGADTLYGDVGSDYLDGGAGNDYLYGGVGDDTYYFEPGYGNDVILEEGGTDIIQFGGGLIRDYVDFVRSNIYGDNGLLIRTNSGDTLRIKNWFAGSDYKVETFRFADGAEMTAAQVDALLAGTQGTTGADTIYGHSYSEVIYAGEGNDLVWSTGGSDTIYGGTGNDDLRGYSNLNNAIYGDEGNDYLSTMNGNDSLWGGAGNDSFNSGSGNDIVWGEAGDDSLATEAGNDTLIGGSGNDLLNGGTGDDTYLYGKGYWNDTISDSDGNDTVRFGSGIDPDSLEMIMPGTSSERNNLFIKITETGETLKLNGWFQSGYFNIENFKFSNGIELTDLQVFELAGERGVRGTDGADSLYGPEYYGVNYYAGSGNDTVFSGHAGDTIWGGPGNDAFYVGGNGNNEIYGEDGDDSYYVTGAGNNYLNGGMGVDTLHGGSGNDTLDSGAGNEYMFGHLGDDTYVYYRGSGNDIITEEGGTDDAVRFDGLLQSDLDIKVSSFQYDDGITARIKDTGEILHLMNWFTGDQYKLERFVFSDESELTGSELQAIAVSNGVQGTESGDQLYGPASYGVNIYGYGGGDNVTAGASNDTIFGGTGSDTLHGGAGADVIYGEDDNDYLYGDAGNDSLLGGIGNDNLNGNADNDTLDGGSGNDMLYGGAGDDTYIYGRGSGMDQLTEENGNDTIQFAEGITPDSIDFTVSSCNQDNGLFVKIKDTGEILRLKSWFTGDQYRIERFRFADGTELTSDQVHQIALANGVVGTEAADTLYGATSLGVLYTGKGGNDWVWAGTGNDTISGGDGGDYLFGNSGDDLIFGDAGNDDIRGQAGNDTLDGGAGNDTFMDSTGDDTYIFGRGSGNDIISEDSGTDTILFGEGVLQDSVFISISSVNGENALVIKINDTGETVRIKNWFNGDQYKVERFVFADGTELSGSAVHDIAMTNGVQGTDSGETLYGPSAYGVRYYAKGGNDTVNAGGGNDTVWGGAGSDNLYAGSGNDLILGESEGDSLHGGAGNDTLDGGAGNDYLYGEAGDDTFVFGRGSGNDFIYEASGTDSIQLSGLTQADVEIGISSASYDNGIYVKIKDTGETLKVINWFAGDQNKIESFCFSDGSTLTGAEVQQIALERGIVGTSSGDALYGPEYGVKISALGGTDTINAGSQSDTLDGGADNDTLNGGAGNDIYLYGIGAGSDTIYDINGTDTVLVGEGLTSDSIEFSVSGSYNDNGLLFKIKNTGEVLHLKNWYSGAQYKVESFRFADGTELTGDQVQQMAEVNGVIGTAAGETIYGPTAYGVSYYTNGGNDTVNAGSGNDTVWGGAGGDWIYAGAGADVIYGEDDNDRIWGNAGNDSLSGGIGNDYIYGEADNDTLDGGTGADTLVGGTGNDTFIIDATNDVITENTNEGTDTVQSPLSYTLGANLENLTLIGGDSVNATGNGLNNYLIGNAANNILDGMAGSDTMAGGAGDDTYIVDNSNDSVIENVSEGVDSVQSSITYTLGNNIENLTLTGTSTINATGNSMDNTLTGNNAGNLLDGGAGNDLLIGGQGNDDYVFSSGFGNDVIRETGGDGLDRVVFGSGIESSQITVFQDGDDLILRNSGSGDQIRLEGWISDPAKRVEQVLFSDNTNWDVDTLFSLLNHAPTAAIPLENQSAREYAPFSYAIPAGSFVDVDPGDTLTYSATRTDGTALPSWLVFNASQMTFSGTPAEEDIGTLSVIVTATDAAGASATSSFDIAVSNNLTSGTDSAEAVTGTNYQDVIYGLGGNDTLYGLGGNDLMDGGAGTDSMIGGMGDDTYVVDVSGDLITELAGEGTDTVQSSISYTLGNNLESLTLMGDSAINGTGNSLDNVMTGNSSNNSLSGAAGDDTIYGGAGNDYMDGGTGADIIYGGEGNDTYVVDDAGDQVSEYAGEGADRVNSYIASYTLADNVEYLTLLGSAVSGTGNTLDNSISGNELDNVLAGLGGNDSIGAGAGNDTIYGGAGSDYIDGGTGADSMYGGEGNDTFVVDDAGDQVFENAGEGADRINSYVANYTLADNVEYLTLLGSAVSGTGNALDNSISGSALDNILSGLGGNDSIGAGAGNDTINGGAGNDYIDGGTGADSMYGGEGNDTFVVDDAGDQVFENAGEGADRINSYVANYTLADNVEYLTLSGSAVSGTGNALDNSISGNALDNILSGLGGNDSIGAGAGNDIIYGGSGNDYMDGGTGADSMYGGEGNDTFVIDDVNDQVFENTGEGSDRVNSYVASYTLADNVEYLTLLGSAVSGTGNALDNSISGNALDNILSGLGGNDSIGAGAGNDTIYGGTGNDYIDGGTGADVMYGGEGNDTYVIDDLGDQIFESAGEGADRVNSYVSSYTLTDNVEYLTLLGSAVSGAGNALDNSISGNALNNILSGLGGNDSIGAGAGNDTIYGGAGNDYIDGGTGADSMYGGEGNDTFVIDDVNDQVFENTGEGSDRVNSYVASYTLADNVEYLTLLGSAVSGTGNDLDNSISGNAFDNILSGLGGNDSIGAGAGNDTIHGGAGNDYMDGGAGSDTYVFMNTDGHDTIAEGSQSGDIDTVNLAGGIGETDPVLVKHNNNLYIFVDQNNYITVNSEFLAANNGIERVEVTDGSYLTRTDIDTIINAMSSINDNSGMGLMDKFTAMSSSAEYDNILAQSWHQS